MIPVAEAIQIVLSRAPKLEAEEVSLTESLGRILAEDIIADSDLPPFDRSQMDGYALRADEVQQTPARLSVAGESIAGKGWHHELQPGTAVRIMTGAPVPAGADSVQQVELTKESEGVVEILEPVNQGRSIVRRGAEIKAGEVVLRIGDQINAAMIAVLASFGYETVQVSAQPRVSVLATGSELVSVSQQPGQDQIRDSNNYSIGAYAKLTGALVKLMPLAGDDIGILKKQIGLAVERSDVVITSGGVSMGSYDFTKAALRELGAEILFERVALRPGKPTVFASMPNGALVFGLPGNPVSVSVTFNLFARAALLRMQGVANPLLAKEVAVLSKALKGSLDRESYLPAQLFTNDEGQLLAEPLKWGGSSDFVAFARATALIVVPAGTGSMSEGERVRVTRLP
ncbi:MAG TPA: gephyrin-like molybdotransferase Glp [Pyrinomonadaceae bacterium]|nr:gephyrin-like molybdotransferase Glp [Pyrinomonadaceae bacterium]